MALRPRHFAAAQYSIIGLFMIASWHVLLSPYDRAADQLSYIFADGYEYRWHFIFLAVITPAALLPAVLYWFARSAS